jgi:hypothetical protein
VRRERELSPAEILVDHRMGDLMGEYAGVEAIVDGLKRTTPTKAGAIKCLSSQTLGSPLPVPTLHPITPHIVYF